MIMDGISVEEFAEIRAREAYDMGEQAGFTKGEQAGVERGAAQEKQEIARNLIALGLSTDQIAKATGLTVEEIEKLQ